MFFIIIVNFKFVFSDQYGCLQLRVYERHKTKVDGGNIS